MEKITLPGSLPGLLRRGSPVIVVREVSGFTLNDKKSSGMPIAYPNASLTILATDLKSKKPFHGVEIDADCMAAASLGGATYVLDPSYVQLDLTDPTGRQHAIWWLAQNATNKFGPLTYDSLHCVYWDHMEYARYAVRAERASDESDWVNLIIAFALNVRAAYDLHIIELESLKGIPAELMPAKALQIVCLHVAKEKGYI